MEWLEKLNNAIGYIEDNLDGTVSFDEAARHACCSVYHFQRMFSYIAGVPLSEYIRRRRMTAAAFELQTGDTKIIDLALKYGYESPTAFTRAFQSVHGISPSAARSEGRILKAFPRVSVTLSIKGAEEMTYRIESKASFRIVGVREHMAFHIEENFARVPLFWQKTTQQGLIPQIAALMNCPPFGLLGVSTCNNGKDLDYYIAAATDKPLPEGFADFTLPSGTWAVFECTGPLPGAMQELQKRIVTEWLPASGYDYADAPDIEVYTDGDQASLNYKSQVWLPVVRKK